MRAFVAMLPSVRPEQPVSGEPLWRRLLRAPETGVGLGLVALLAVFTVTKPDRFATVDNLRNLAADASILIILTMVTTYVVIGGGLDLSVGSVIAFSEVIAAKVFASGDGGGMTIVLGLCAAVGCGITWGAVNGFLVTRLAIPSFVATLATLGIALGAANVVSNGTDIADVPLSLTEQVGIGQVAGVPVLVLIAAAVVLAAAYCLRCTRFGRHTYGIGSDRLAAERAGIDVRRHTFALYVLAGTAYGLAAFLNLARFSTTTIGGHNGDALNSIAAVALGGTSLYGGVGSALGSLIGVFIPAVLQNGLVISRIPPFYQQIGVGVALLVAIYLDQLRRRSWHAS